jgi:hypothetical protein
MPFTRAPGAALTTEEDQLRKRLRLAMFRAPRVLPQPIAAIIARECDYWIDVGYRFGDHATMTQLAELLLVKLPEWKEPEHGS